MSSRPTTTTRTTIPQTWLDAEAESGTVNDGRPLDRRSRSKMPSRDRLDGFSAGVLSILVMSISIVGWSWAQLSNTSESPWPAVAIGIALAVAIRVGGGAVDSTTQSFLSLFSYLFVLVTTTAFVVWRDATTLYGDDIGVDALDAEITNRFLTEPAVVAAWLLGAAAAFTTSLVIGRR